MKIERAPRLRGRRARSHQRAAGTLRCRHEEVLRRLVSTLDPSRGDELVRSLANTPVAEAMDARALVLPASAGADAAAELLRESNVGGAPVIDDDARLVGFVCTSDLLWLGEERDADCARDGATRSREGRAVRLARGFLCVTSGRSATVEAAMTPFVYALRAEAPVGRGVALMALEGVHRLPIIDGSRRVVGVLSTIDVLRWFRHRAGWPGCSGWTERD